jgi:hypothetical protein
MVAEATCHNAIAGDVILDGDVSLYNEFLIIAGAYNTPGVHHWLSGFQLHHDMLGGNQEL